MITHTAIRAMRLIHICLAIIISATFGLRGVDFDIYPSFNSADDDDSLSSNSPDAIDIGRVLTKLGATIGVGGGAYIGFQLVRKAYRHLRKSSDSKSKSWAEDLIKSNVVATTVPGVNVTMIEEMKKEQEELWRFIHSLFKNQEEMMVKLEKSINSGIPESMLKELEESFDSKIADLSRRLDILDSKLKGIEKDMPDKDSERLTVESVQSIVGTETKEIYNSMVILKKETKNQMLKWLKEHDDAIVEKIRYFGEDIKKLVKNENPDIVSDKMKSRQQSVSNKNSRK